MKLSPTPKDTELTSPAWQKWLSNIFEWSKKVETSGDVIVDSSSKGLVLKDSSGTYWRISVSTAGAVSATDIGTSLP